MRRVVGLFSALVLLLVSAACTSSNLMPSSGTSKTPFSSPSSIEPQSPPTRSSSSGPEASTSPSTTGDPVVVVKDPWHTGEFQKGMQIYWHSQGSDEEIEHVAARVLNYVAGLNANSISITFPVYTDGITPTKVYAGKETPSVQQLELVIQAAKVRKFRIMLRPIIDEANIAAEQQGGWRGNIKPPRPSEWFASYESALMPYLTLANREHVNEFVAGTELFSMQQYQSAWKQLRQKAATVFGGELSYGINWDGFGRHDVPFTTLGIDLYPEVDLDDDASVKQLADALTGWLKQQPASIRSRLTIQEAGIAAESGAYRHPWYWGGSKQLNFTVQAHWFEASYLAAVQAKTQGIYYWMVDSNLGFESFDPASQPAGSFVGRPAEGVIKRMYS